MTASARTEPFYLGVDVNDGYKDTKELMAYIYGKKTLYIYIFPVEGTPALKIRRREWIEGAENILNFLKTGVENGKLIK
jgi:hypothetical protein